MMAIYENKLNWHPDNLYRLFDRPAAREWDWGHDIGPKPQSVGFMRVALSVDPHFSVLICHGLFDLITPYFATKLLLDQIPLSVGGDRVALQVYPGGHMSTPTMLRGPRCATLRRHSSARAEQCQWTAVRRGGAFQVRQATDRRYLRHHGYHSAEMGLNLLCIHQSDRTIEGFGGVAVSASPVARRRAAGRHYLANHEIWRWPPMTCEDRTVGQHCESHGSSPGRAVNRWRRPPPN